MIRKLLSLGLVLLAIFSCKKTIDTSIPNVPVSESLTLAEPSNFPLTAQGGWVYHPGGYRGLIVYRRAFSGNTDDFVTYDRACPRHYEQSCGKTNVTDDDFYIQCVCDSSQWYLLNGFPEQQQNGLLKQYRTRFTQGIIYISN